jgi:integrase/recombinase XerD
MTLSAIYKDPSRLAEVRDCGPLSRYLDGFVDYLQQQCFSRYTIRLHVCAVEELSLHCKKLKPWRISDLYKNAETYLKSQRFIGKDFHRKQTRYGFNRFLDYLVQCHGFIMPSQTVPYQAIYKRYQQWLREVRQLSPGTIELRCHYLLKFLHWYHDKRGARTLRQLTHAEVEEFVVAQTAQFDRPFKRSLQSTLRGFLRFCFEQGFCRQDFSAAVPKIRRYCLDQVPKAIAEAQAQKLLAHIDRSTPVGKRAYAIVLLLYTYGVRGTQVRRLLLEDFDWRKGEIFFRAVKNAKSSRLPLSAEVGEALVDYLRYGRAQSQYPQVFLTLKAPYQPLRRSSNLSQIIHTQMHKHHINSPSQGGHCFRHAFVSRLLKQGESFKHVADLLGHRHLSTTFLYTKIDVNALAEVGLALPEV